MPRFVFSTLLMVCVPMLTIGAFLGEIETSAGPSTERPAVADKSQLLVNAKTRVTVMLVDPKKRRTGVDPQSSENVHEIPHSSSEVDYIANQYTGQARWEAYQRMQFEPMAPGTYHVLIKGLQDGPFEIDFIALSLDGSSLPSKKLEGLIEEGEQRFFLLRFDNRPKGEMGLIDEKPTRQGT